MRILLTSNASHDPPRGGATRSNLIWLEHLAAAGHECRVLAPAAGESFRSTRNGVSIHSIQDFGRQRGVLTEEIRIFGPDWVLVSSEDLSHALLREASDAA